MTCDLNCDMGEGIGNDEAIIPFITSANIACGYHAGNPFTMHATVQLAKKFGVAVGAHPSFYDPANFGRMELHISPAKVYKLVTDQLILMQEVVMACDIQMHHVKPHGALYNMAARSKELARAIATATFNHNRHLVLYGLSGSWLIAEAKAIGLRTASEVFADRTYQNDGSLTPRNIANALIEDEEQSLRQVLQMLQHGKVTTIAGKQVPITAETICLHGDGNHAASFAKKINEQLQQNNVRIAAL